jgi:predicted transcriptional regulator
MGTKNVTLSLPEEVLREAKVLAVRRGTSVSALLAGALSELVERESGYAAARERSLAAMEEGGDLGTGGEISWGRDELHER